MRRHPFAYGFTGALNGKSYCSACKLPIEHDIHKGEDMADIDAVDNHMGRKAELPKPHLFVGPTQQSTCDVCGTLRIHSNHKGYDYDSAPKQLPHEYLSPGDDETLGCVTCRYSKDALHHTNHNTPTRGLHIRPDRCVNGLCECEKHKPETIAEEASRIVYGDREQTYDDPYSNFQRIAYMWTGTLLKKLAPGMQITAIDVALCMVQLKVAREVHKPQRDNRVDIIGYVLCGDRIVQAEDKSNATG